MGPTADTSTLEPGSFRDPESRVFYAGESVYRALSPDGLSDFEALRAAKRPVIEVRGTCGDCDSR